MNATYTRGTKIRRVTTKALRPGDVVLTNDCPANPQFAALATTKTGTTLRTVAGSEYVQPRRGYGERNVRIVVQFTDGTVSPSQGGATTWMVADLVAEAPASREEAEVVAEAAAVKEAPVEVAPAKPAGRCACCGEAKTGKGSYLPGHDAKHASRLVLAVAAGRLTIETALAEIPAKQEKLIAKVAARINALPQP